MPGRLLDCTLGNPFQNIALEEAIFLELKEPLLRIWENQKSVVIGRGQLARLETDLDLCRRRGIPVVRRFTAGGAVYNGPGNINWSIFEPRPSSEKGGVFDAGRVFDRIGKMVVRALKGCSVEAHFEPPNRITNGLGKISGMAAYVSAKAVVCHGTLLSNADLREAEELTRPLPEGAERRYARSMAAAMANCGVGKREFVNSLAEVLLPDATAGGLSQREAEVMRDLVEGRYSKDSWNLGDPFDLDEL